MVRREVTSPPSGIPHDPLGARLTPVSDIPPPPGADQPTSTPPPPPPLTPPPPPPPNLSAPAGYVAYQSHATPLGALKRVGGLSKAIVVLTAIVAVATLVTTLLSIGIAGDASDFLAGDLTDDEFRTSLAPLSAVQSIAGVATLATGILTMIWMYRVAVNIRAFGRRTTWHPLFSIFGWFLPPFFLYVIPFLVLREQWKGSDPIVDGTDGWKADEDNRTLWGWFAFYGLLPLVLFVAQIGSVASAGLGTGDVETVAESLDQVSALTFMSAVSVIGAAAFWIVFVRRLTGRHVALTNEA